MKTQQETETFQRQPQHRQRLSGRRAAWGWRLAAGTGRGAARGFLRFWPLWEHFTLWLWKVQFVPNAPYGLFQVSIHPYRGRPMVLPDGTSIASGDPIMELHLVNWRLAAAQQGRSARATPVKNGGTANGSSLPPVRGESADAQRRPARATNGSENAETQFPQAGLATGPQALRAAGRQPLALLKEIREDLAAIAQGFQEQRYPSSVRALYGITILAAATPRLGFTLRPRPLNLHGRLERFFLKGLLALYNADGLARLERGSAKRDLRPQEVWMSVETLLERYGDQPS